MTQDSANSARTERLLELAGAGQSQAVDELLARHRPYLQQFVGLRFDPLLRRRADPSDVVQEAQIEAARRLAEYLQQPEMPFRLWLRQIACDRLVMLRRRHLGAARRSVHRDVALPEQSSVALARQLLARGATPSEQVARRELARRVHQALTRLPEADRDMLLMRNFEGLSNQEAAQVLRISPTAASQRYGRALLRLRNVMIGTGLSGAQP
jgi:RNA polymerase sigma-70 factor (ECF subfamily)